MTVTLERIIYGTSEASDEVGIIAISDHLTPQDAALWRGITSLKPMDASTFAASRAFGIFAGPGERSVWACAYRSAGRTFFEYIVLPREVIASLAGNLAPLVGLVVSPADEQAHSARIAPVKLNSTAHWTPPQRRAQVEALLARGMDMNQALRLLGAALHERGLMIHDFPADTDSRLSVVQGLMALLPARSRPDLTFSTNRHEKTMTQARVVFAPASIVTGRLLANWATHTFPDDEALEAPFIRRLIALWKGDLGAFLSAIDQMDSIASTLVVNRNLQNSLTVVAERHALDAQILAGEDAPPEALKAVMNDIPPEGDLKRLYAERLLAHALEARDADAALIVARVMDDDPELDRVLYAQLETDLDTQPDAVYSFVRTRLSGGGEDDGGRWAARLKAAALASLRVAITDGDGETAINWLRLVAREPASYDLGEVLHNGILGAGAREHRAGRGAGARPAGGAARPGGARNPARRRRPAGGAPQRAGAALRQGEGDPIAILQLYGVEVFLVALAQAHGRSQRCHVFTAGTIAQVWAITSRRVQWRHVQCRAHRHRADQQWGGVAARRRAGNPARCDAARRRDDLSHQLIHQISQRDDFPALVVNAMSQSERSDSEALALIAQMIAVGDLTSRRRSTYTSACWSPGTGVVRRSKSWSSWRAPSSSTRT
ncbi:MAG: hypothetical protein U0703_00335 [Anaerolineae bacterium]